MICCFDVALCYLRNREGSSYVLGFICMFGWVPGGLGGVLDRARAILGVGVIAEAFESWRFRTCGGIGRRCRDTISTFVAQVQGLLCHGRFVEFHRSGCASTRRGPQKRNFAEAAWTVDAEGLHRCESMSAEAVGLDISGVHMCMILAANTISQVRCYGS